MSAALLIAAAVTAATPVQPNTWFTSKEHPKTALRVTERGHVSYTIDVAPDGSAIRCTPSQTGDLDDQVCAIVMKRAHFTPATDANGQPTFSLHEGTASFLMPGSARSRPDPAKLTMKVGQLPEGVTGPAYAKVAFTVDASGKIANCASTAPERRRFMQTIEALGPAACEALAKDYRPTPARNAAGEAVASAQSAVVRFEVP